MLKLLARGGGLGLIVHKIDRSSRNLKDWADIGELIDSGVDDGEAVIEDRVRLTRLDAATWGLSVKRHNGRWERTPFTGDVAEPVDVMLTFMQHLVAS